MNKEGLEKLITALENSEDFRWNEQFKCLDALAGKLLGKNPVKLSYEVFKGSGYLKELLEIPQYQATNLYIGKTLDGIDLLTDENFAVIPKKDGKEVALTYLRSLR